MRDLLRVEGLTSVFDVDGRTVPVVRGVSFAIRVAETLALGGESGSGKSVTALSLLRLLVAPGRIAVGSVRWRSRDVADLDDAALQEIRGGEIGLVPQDPDTALNPVFTIGDQIVETMLAHKVATRRDVHARMLDLLDAVRIPDAARRARDYPHQLSGGLRQRAMIALGLAGDPALLIADEPTTGLDAPTQARIVELLRDLVERRGLAMLIISHDLDVVASCADQVAVMYAGEIVEQGPTRMVLDTPAHPYTRGLVASVPGATPGTPLATIEGIPPAPGVSVPGCAFAPRCPERFEPCDQRAPGAWVPAVGVTARCHLYDPAGSAPGAGRSEQERLGPTQE